METPEEHAARVARLEEARAARRDGRELVPAGAQAQLPGPVELAPGRGDLNYTSTPWMGAPLSTSGLSLVDGRTVSFATLFATQPWVAAAVMRLLTLAVRVPLKCYRRTGDDSRERLRPDDHPLAEAIVHPWDRAGQVQFTMALLGSLLVHGNGVMEVEQGRGDRIRFGELDYRYTKPILPWRDVVAGWNVLGEHGQPDREASSDKVLHAAWWSPLGPLGVSPLAQLGITLLIEDAAQRYQRATFRNGARPPSAITATEQFLDLDRVERTALLTNLREDVDRLYSGPENRGRPALLPPGLDWKPIGHTAVEAALIEQRKIAMTEVAAVYMVPPPMIAQLDRATYSNISELRQIAYTDGLGPPLVLIESAVNAQLVHALLGEDDVYVEYDFGGVLRGDRLKEVEALRESIASALQTPNEARSTLNLPRSTDPGMDDFYLPTNNLRPVGSPPAPEERDVPPTTTEREREAPEGATDDDPEAAGVAGGGG